MLGITAPSAADFIAFGTLALAVFAYVFGGKTADVAKKEKPLDPTTSGIAAGFVDKDLMMRQVMATESIAVTLKEIVGIQTDEHERAVIDRLADIEEALKKGADARPRRPSPKRD